jgi:hypothetical protein
LLIGRGLRKLPAIAPDFVNPPAHSTPRRQATCPFNPRRLLRPSAKAMQVLNLRMLLNLLHFCTLVKFFALKKIFLKKKICSEPAPKCESDVKY